MRPDRQDWADVVNRLAGRIAATDYPTGALAELRRLDPDMPDGPAFWRLMVAHADAFTDDPAVLRVLAALLRALALAERFHEPRRPFGRAMAENGIAELRLLRLLRTGRRELPDELRRLARMLAAKGPNGRFDWVDAAQLLWTADTPQAGAIRAAIARDYYRAQHQQQNSGEVAA